MAIDESAQSPLMESGFDCGVSSKPKDGDDSDMSQSVCNGKQCAVGTISYHTLWHERLYAYGLVQSAVTLIFHHKHSILIVVIKPVIGVRFMTFLYSLWWNDIGWCHSTIMAP